MAIEMNTLSSYGALEAAREKARAILALNQEDKKTQELSVNPTKGTINGHEWVDLGLPSGLKWATCNVGTSSPEEYGSYFAWGETRPKSEYTLENYRFRVSGVSADSYKNLKFSKYVTQSKWGAVDNKTCLELSDDAARSNWGGSWRLPSEAEWTELRTQCNWTWTIQGGKNGYKVASKKNGNSVFLPAAGYRSGTELYYAGSNGFYWSSTLEMDSPCDAWSVTFHSTSVGKEDRLRYYGFPVRPVSE